MASEGSTEMILKRRNDEIALMPPPPVKKIKRPTEVLDEDEYTEALSDIIARDYYPGLREAKAQEEYLQALDSKNARWILEAERELRAARDGDINPPKYEKARTSRDSRFNTPNPYQRAADTPRTPSGAETPISIKITDDHNHPVERSATLDASKHSLSSYQAKYTSEDNASFNTILDSQNLKRRSKHAHLWTPDQRILSQRLITHRNTQQALITQKESYKSTNDGLELISLTTGAVSTRPARPETWKSTNPTNTFMFMPESSVDEQGLQTIAELKQSLSKAGPKEIVFENTRFPPSGPRWEADADADDATSIHTSFIARRQGRGHAQLGGTDTGTITGAETPRVNGYAFIDDEEPNPAASEATYRDLLAGQMGDEAPNPFRLKDTRARENLHHRLVERDAELKRVKQKHIQTGRGGESGSGNMTPAARMMMERLGGRTPVVGGGSRSGTGGTEARREDWTPVSTPRRSRAAVK